MKRYFRNLWLAVIGRADRRARQAFEAGYIRSHFMFGRDYTKHDLTDRWLAMEWDCYRGSEPRPFACPIQRAYEVGAAKG